MQAEYLCVLLGGTIFLGNTIQRDNATKSEDIILWNASWILVNTNSPPPTSPDGTISLGNTCQRDKTSKHENIYNTQAE